jgi:hypothetical protein
VSYALDHYDGAATEVCHLSRVAFLNSVHATEVDIQARVTGSIYSSGPVLIGGNGSINGDVTARSVSIELGDGLRSTRNRRKIRPTSKHAALPFE